MPRQLTPRSTLENLKREAKRWLKALRENAGDARARLARALPNAPGVPTLRDVQHALALEHGLAGWTALKRLLAAGIHATPTRTDPAASFLENASLDWRVGGPMRTTARHTADRLLRKHPELARENIYTAVVCGDLAEVERLLAERPELATDSGGPRNWPPLLYLCTARLSVPAANENALAIARVLLDHGADPNSYYPGGSESIHYTALTCVIGEGEEGATRHPQFEVLARLLLERGAEPYDIQLLYNAHFRGDILSLLKLMHERALQLGRQADWDDPQWRMLDMGGYGPGAHYLLGIAVRKNDLPLAEWILSHGASPEAGVSSHRKFKPAHSFHELALRLGHAEMADLLVRYGAKPSMLELDGEDAFAAACFRLDRERARQMVAEHSEYLRSTQTIFAAARRDRADVIALLLDLGTPLELADKSNQRALHVAAGHQAMNVAKLLLDRGAEIDPVESNWGNTPLGAAAYAQDSSMIDLLSRVSGDVFELTFAGKLERLRDVLSADPALAKLQSGSQTPLMWLPDDEARALEIAALFLAHGADPSVRNEKGETAADRARKRGMDEVANLLRTRGGSAQPLPPYAYVIDLRQNTVRLRRRLSAREADALVVEMNEQQITGVDAGGHMTDSVLERIAQLDHVTRLDLNDSTDMTDEGLRQVARMTLLEHLDIGGWKGQITDSGLEVLRHLPELTHFKMFWQQHVSDAGIANLAGCHQLERVELLGTPTGDGAIAALAGKRELRHFKTGERVTDGGLPLLHEFPAFKRWQGGEPSMALLGFDAEPNLLLLRGPFTDAGLAHLVGLDGLFALNLDDSKLGITAAGLAPLATLPNLGWLAFDATDDAMPFIAAMPRLRFLMCQDTSAGDDGFSALSRSPSIEYLWGRRCYNLRGRGFAAMAAMPALRGLSVSCKNVDDAALAALPDFPTLREFMPMDVPDEGFRHIGRCSKLEALECMYVAEMSDAATAHITGLSRLASYRTWSSRITDRSLELLARMPSIERLLFENIPGITDVGLAALAGLPRLREIDLEMVPQVTAAGTAVFPAHVRVGYIP